MSDISFPRENIDPRDKEKAPWLLSYARAAYAEWRSTRKELDLDTSRLEQIRRYAFGKQSTSIVRDQLGLGDGQFRPGDPKKELNEWLKIDSRPLAIYTKIRTIALRRITGQGYQPRVTPLDITAQSEKEEHIKGLQRRMMLREQIRQVNPSLVEKSPVALKQGEPDDSDELDLYSQFTYRHAAGAQMEVLLRAVHQDSNFNQVRRQVRRDLLDFGIAASRERVDPNGRIRAHHIPIDRLVLDVGEEDDFSDSRYFGEIRYVTLEQLKLEAGDAIDEEDYEGLARTYAGRLSNPEVTPTNYWTTRVAVIDLEIKTTDARAWYRGKNKRGNRIVSRTKPNSRKPGVTHKRVEMLYKVSHVIDTKYVYDYGRATNQKRARGRMAETNSSFTVRCVERQGRHVTSIGRRVMPVIDSLTLSWAKFQQARASLQAAGFGIDVMSINEISLGEGGQAIPVESLMDLFFQRNVMLFKRYDLDDGKRSGSPIESIPGSGYAEMQAMFGQVQQDIGMLREVTGLNEFTDGSTPGERSLTTVAKMASESTNNALEEVRDAELELMGGLNKELIRRAQTLARTGNFDYYTRALGDDSLRFWSDHAGVAFGEFAVEVEMLPSAEDRERLMNMATQKHMQGLITLEDLYLIEHTDNIKFAQATLANRIEKRRLKQRLEAMEQSQVESEIAQQANDAKRQGEIDMLKFKYELEEQKAQAAHERKKEIEAQIMEGKKELAFINTLSGEQRELTKAQGSERVAEIRALMEEYKAELSAIVKTTTTSNTTSNSE